MDEFGTATQESEGWAIVCLGEPQAAAFIAEAPSLLGGGLKKFHGKDFTVEIVGEDLRLKQPGAYTLAVP
jgi:hypothetical protein